MEPLLLQKQATCSPDAEAQWGGHHGGGLATWARAAERSQNPNTSRAGRRSFEVLVGVFQEVKGRRFYELRLKPLETFFQFRGLHIRLSVL